MLGFIPSRFSQFTSYLDVYFAMARGSKDHVASEMTKWFNTNYHYIVPEYEEGLQISLKDNRPLRLYEEAKQELGVDGKPVILGPYTFLKLAKRLYTRAICYYFKTVSCTLRTTAFRTTCGWCTNHSS